jgi:chromosome segregation ATPase
MSKKRTLSAALVAALASGAELSPELKAQHEADLATEATEAAAAAAAALAAKTGEETEEQKTARLAAEAAAATAAAAKTEGETDEQKKARVDAETAAAAAAKKPAGTNALVDHLKSELATEREALTALRVKHTAAESELASAKADITNLSKIARDATTRLCLALNAEAIGLDALTPSQLCAYHADADAKFKTKFKVGATASTGAEVDNGGKGTKTEASEAVDADLTQARVRATSMGGNKK